MSVLKTDISTSTKVGALLLHALGAGLTVAAVRLPLLGPAAYALVSYALPREHPVTVLLMETWSSQLITLTSVTATLASWLTSNRRALPLRGVVVWSVLAYSFWVGVAIVMAIVK